MATQQFSYPAPKRNWYVTPNGGWASQPWTQDEKTAYMEAGGWFNGTQDTMSDAEAAAIAEAMKGW